MPAKTEKQRRFIFAKRREYGDRKNTPKKFKWIWGKEWEKLAENFRIKRFSEFQ
jgi:hypothetical protein